MCVGHSLPSYGKIMILWRCFVVIIFPFTCSTYWFDNFAGNFESQLVPCQSNSSLCVLYNGTLRDASVPMSDTPIYSTNVFFIVINSLLVLAVPWVSPKMLCSCSEERDNHKLRIFKVIVPLLFYLLLNGMVPVIMLSTDNACITEDVNSINCTHTVYSKSGYYISEYCFSICHPYFSHRWSLLLNFLMFFTPLLEIIPFLLSIGSQKYVESEPDVYSPNNALKLQLWKLFKDKLNTDLANLIFFILKNELGDKWSFCNPSGFPIFTEDEKEPSCYDKE